MFVGETLFQDNSLIDGSYSVLYVIHSNSKNSNKSKLVKSMYRVYHESQRLIYDYPHIHRYCVIIM